LRFLLYVRDSGRCPFVSFGPGGSFLQRGISHKFVELDNSNFIKLEEFDDCGFTQILWELTA
jgi:hypothetical protein